MNTYKQLYDAVAIEWIARGSDSDCIATLGNSDRVYHLHGDHSRLGGDTRAIIENGLRTELVDRIGDELRNAIRVAESDVVAQALRWYNDYTNTLSPAVAALCRARKNLDTYLQTMTDRRSQ